MGVDTLKYMGSKRSMLSNGLGELITEKTPSFDRFVDLFAGSGFVSWYVAEKFSKPVFSIDLQKYSTILSEAVLLRTKPLNYKIIVDKWINNSISKRDKSPYWRKAKLLSDLNLETPQYVKEARILCENKSKIGPIWNAYGGHYFSPSQAITFDYLLKYLPVDKKEKSVCLAACVSAASECVASPGHTAQPFQPTKTAAKYIKEAWNRDPIVYCKKNLLQLCSMYAKVKGKAKTGNAQDFINKLTPRDLVFIDPPYSGVQYSRFYHVLETISCEKKQITVSGAGRYESIEERPQSEFCNLSQSKKAVDSLLEKIAIQGSTIIFTFPSGKTSNGLSGDYIKETASKWFFVEDKNTVEGKFSTLGGNNEIRDARKKSSELILYLTPKQIPVTPN
jgi:adenine-specific DNA-methyltransferase